MFRDTVRFYTKRKYQREFIKIRYVANIANIFKILQDSYIFSSEDLYGYLFDKCPQLNKPKEKKHIFCWSKIFTDFFFFCFWQFFELNTDILENVVNFKTNRSKSKMFYNNNNNNNRNYNNPNQSIQKKILDRV